MAFITEAGDYRNAFTFNGMQAGPTSSVPEPDLELRQVWAGYNPEAAAVTLSNSLAAGATRLSLIAWRLLLLALSAIRKGDTALHLTSIDVQAYLDVYHPGKKRHSIGGELRDALSLLATRSVTLHGQGGRTVPWLDAGSARYVPASASETGRATVFLRLHQDLTPELTQQTGRFVLLPLSKFVGLESKYAPPLRLLLQARGGWLSAFHTEVFVDDLRRSLGVEEGQYGKWHDFRRCVLDVAIAELREQHDLDIEIEIIKRARRAHKVRFRGRAIAKPLTSNEEPALEQWATQVARDHRFNGSLEPYGKLLGWDAVAGGVQRSLERGQHGNQPVRSMAAYLRTVLDTMLIDRGLKKDDDPDPPPPEPTTPKGGQSAPDGGTTLNVTKEATELLDLLDRERIAHFERFWEALDQEEKDRIDVASSAIEQAAELNGIGGATRIRGIRRNHLKQGGHFSYPPELESLEAFVETYGLLAPLPPNERERVLTFAKGFYDPW